MKVTYNLTFEDHLALQLFGSSRSPKNTKKRRRSRFLFPVVYLCMGSFFFFVIEDLTFGIALWAIAGVWSLFYPAWDKKRHTKHFKNFITKNYSERIGNEITLEITDEQIHTVTDRVESTVSTSLIEEITELPTLVILKVRSEYHIFPITRMENSNELIAYLKGLAERLNVPYRTEPDWEWK